MKHFSSLTPDFSRGNFRDEAVAFGHRLILVLAVALIFSNCETNPYADGQEFYKTNCANCHMDNGEGLAGLIPPLAGADFLERNHEKLPCIIRFGLEGEISVNGKIFSEKMAGVPAASDVDITNVLNFVNHNWGNRGRIFKLDEVREFLKKCEK